MVAQKRLYPIYCIDTSALINLTRYPGYPKDIFPGIWEKLENMVEKGELISHMEVYEEVANGEKDEIYDWCRNHRKMFKDADDCRREQLKRIKEKYNEKTWNRETSRVGRWADPWVIALSICEDAVIVTDERNKNKPDGMPRIASHSDKQCLDLIEFFRKIGVKY